jgi:glycosyltransferase involved in cell wall biosynthesis
LSLKIAIVVHGRFYAFDLARELLRRGHDVTLFTNYPRFVAERFGVPRERVHHHLVHGAAARFLGRLFPGGLGGRLDRVLNTAFGRWAARRVAGQHWDVVLGFSGASEETFRALAGAGPLRFLQRGSSHIRVQWQLLKEEEARVGRPLEKPSAWIVAREEREYALADAIAVLSEFAHHSFVSQGVAPEKLFRLAMGVNVAAFRPSAEVIAERCRRIRGGAPLRVLNVGTFSYRKGAQDFADLAGRLDPRRFALRCVGPVAADTRALQRRLRGRVEFIGRRPERDLPQEYVWGDVFVLPAIEDGFAVVLTQALASGLPLLTSTNCGGPDLIDEGRTGWVVPIRAPQALAERLEWCDGRRPELVEMVRHVYNGWRPFDWADTARQAEKNILAALAAGRRQLTKQAESQEAGQRELTGERE